LEILTTFHTLRLINENIGDVTITNDDATILKEFGAQHP
jgi:hypothetical protein